jgi:DNA-binding beta-propeller fold protein YncE
MAVVCGDNNGPTPWMHPSNKYIFVADNSTNSVPILYFSSALQKLEPSGSSIPGIPSTVAFGPDGLLVYAVQGNEILVYAL